MLFSIAISGSQHNKATVNYQNIIDEESAYLYSLQLDNGCYPMTSYCYATDGYVQMNPYFADFTALALLESGQTYLPSVKKYLDWHFLHLNSAEEDINNVAGTIYDYLEYVDSGSGDVKEETVFIQDGKAFYDSTDSYAALYLKVLYRYLQVSGEESYLIAHKDQIDSLIGVLETTMVDGLSTATPSFHTQYLMDNAEVYDGLNDGISLYQQLFPSDSIHINEMEQMESQIQDKILTTMWHDGPNGYFDSMLEQQESGQYSAPIFCWNTFYMDATSQLYLITSGVLSPQSDTAAYLYRNFNRHWDNGTSLHSWTLMDIPDEYYWSKMAYCAALMGDSGRVDQYLSTYETKVHSTEHAYPLYNADVAEVVRTAALCKAKLHSQPHS